jgi:hypothetical protein
MFQRVRPKRIFRISGLGGVNGLETTLKHRKSPRVKQQSSQFNLEFVFELLEIPLFYSLLPRYTPRLP